jgi:hypothetical protein
MPALAMVMVMVCPSATVIGRPGPSEGVRNCGDRETASRKYISNFSFPALFSANRYTIGGARCGPWERGTP